MHWSGILNPWGNKMTEQNPFKKVLIPESKTAVKVTLKEMPNNSFIGYIEGYIPTVAGVKASIVVCDLGALTCVDMAEITVLNKNDPALQDITNKVNTLSYEALCKVTDPNKSKYQQANNLLKTLNSFQDDRTGENFGSVGTWGTDKALVLDGMTGVCQSYIFNAIGGKPMMSQNEYQLAQNGVFQLIFKLTNHCKCHFVLQSHVVREVDQLTGSSKLMMMTIGEKLTPKIPLWFSDVILTVREGAKFSWDTANALADLKTRNLPIQAGLQPDFKLIIDKWRKRNTL